VEESRALTAARLGLLAGYICVALWIAAGRPPVRMTVWSWVQRGCYRLALTFGIAGLHAEGRYTRARAAESYADGAGS
jgi:hypothetical protein